MSSLRPGPPANRVDPADGAGGREPALARGAMGYRAANHYRHLP
jgi:hypothetical protein